MWLGDVLFAGNVATRMHDRPTTTDPIQILPRAANINPADLEFVRLPQVGQRCAETFYLSRAALNEMILPCAKNNFRPPVKSFCLRQKGAKTGIRLIDRASLVLHIRSHEEKPGDESAKLATT